MLYNYLSPNTQSYNNYSNSYYNFVIVIIGILNKQFQFFAWQPFKFSGKFPRKKSSTKIKKLNKNHYFPKPKPNIPKMLARNLFTVVDDYYNEEAAEIVIAAQEVICDRNFNLALFGREDHEADDEPFQVCVGCMVAIPTDQSSRFCGPNCSGLGVRARIKSLSVNMGLSYLVPMSSLVKQARVTPFAFQTIVMYLYDHHFGVRDVLTMWDKISADFVYRNPKLLKL